jgi:RNA polymerase sigma-70 factor, ECF subfamily
VRADRHPRGGRRPGPGHLREGALQAAPPAQRRRRRLFYDERRQAARRATDPAAPEDFERLEARGGPAEEVEQRELLAAIAELPDEFRDVLVAVDVAGLSYKEASKLIGVPEGTVMSRLYRARKRVIEAYG